MTDIIAQFRVEIERAGLLPGNVIADGRLHRCGTVLHPRSTNGRYWLHADSPPNGGYVAYDLGVEEDDWRPDSTDDLTEIDIAKIEKQRRDREAKRAEYRRLAAEKAQADFNSARPADPRHPYLIAKQIEPHGIRQKANRLLIPIYNTDNQITSLQEIYPIKGKPNKFIKSFRENGQIKGCCFPIPLGADVESELVICEGFATGASIYEATEIPTLCALSANNLTNIAIIARKKYESIKIIIAADDDHEKEYIVGNAGIMYAVEAAIAIDAHITVP